MIVDAEYKPLVSDGPSLMHASLGFTCSVFALVGFVVALGMAA
jgi:hypothetical protein